jgi:hypothetical protein
MGQVPVRNGETMTKIRVLFFAGICIFTWSTAQASLLTFTANLTPAQTAPPSGCTFNGAPCFGTATLVVDTNTDALSLLMTYTVGAAWNLHVDDGTPGTNGPTEVFLRGDLAVPCGVGTFCRDISMTDGFSLPSSNLSDLIAGNDYIVVTEISSSPDGSGLIRGQLQQAPEPGSLTLVLLVLALAVAAFTVRSRANKHYATSPPGTPAKG